jgi:alginate O-acetyltransferase complex protein AlgI
MVFNSLAFMIFLLAVLALDRVPLSWRVRKSNLLIASLLFYSAWYPPAVLLLLATLTIDYFAARAIHAATDSQRRKLFLFASLAGNFGVLGFFKYAGFFWSNMAVVGHWLGLNASTWNPAPFLPLGISFYTFQSVSYVVDVYRRRTTPANSLLDFGLYVSFFPHLVAGPIVRFADFYPQLAMPKRASIEQISEGLLLFVFGLFLKVTLGDSIFAPIVEAVYGSAHVAAQPVLDSVTAWAGILGFAGQLYCDFAGYSMCAVGLALCFGFHFPWNFRLPYGSGSFTEFWTRWHISLSTWIRDYIYIPLGGSRRGAARTSLNLMIAFVLSGFWHGASWTFGIWGAMHGALLVIEKLLAPTYAGRIACLVPVAIRALLVTAIYALTLVFFRSQDLHQAIYLLERAFAFVPRVESYSVILFLWQVQLCFATMAALFLFHLAFKNRGPISFFHEHSMPLRSCTVAVLLMVMLTTLPEKGHVFIYFQF